MTDISLFLYTFIFFFTLAVTVLLGRIIIPFLKKRAEQPIYTEGPSWHASKAGTPTMGGLTFVISITVALLLALIYGHLFDDTSGAYPILSCLVYSLLNASIGFIDDLTKLKRKKNAGLTPRQKLVLQFICSGLFLAARAVILDEGTSVSFSFGEIDLGIFYYFISLIILVGITNCANLTDGIDGLASTVAFGIGISLFYVSYYRSSTASIICISLAGAAVGFLIFNVHPAKVFMGDTGSLFFGSLVASLAFEMKNPFVAVISGGVYVIEGISVILQVIVYKLTKKRIFKMAPLHHHLEKSGYDENKICICALILTIILALPVVLICVK